MNFSAESLPSEVHFVAAWICAVWIIGVLRHIHWKALALNGAMHRLLGSMVVVALVWSMKGRVGPGFDLHLLGSSTLTLMLGFPLGSLALVVGAAVATFNDLGDWLALPINLVIGGLVPALTTHGLQRYGEPHLPANFFAYLFLLVFFGTAAGVVIAGACATGLLTVFGGHEVGILMADYFPYYFLLAFAESWLSGAGIAVMIVWLPGWVAGFDEKRYFPRQ